MNISFSFAHSQWSSQPALVVFFEGEATLIWTNYFRNNSYITDFDSMASEYGLETAMRLRQWEDISQMNPRLFESLKAELKIEATIDPDGDWSYSHRVAAVAAEDNRNRRRWLSLLEMWKAPPGEGKGEG